MTVTVWTRDGLGTAGGYSYGISPLGSDDDKPYDKIVFGRVSSPWWMWQNATLVVSRVSVINIKMYVVCNCMYVSLINIRTRSLGIPCSLLYAVAWNLTDFDRNFEDVVQLCQCCRNFMQFI